MIIKHKTINGLDPETAKEGRVSSVRVISSPVVTPVEVLEHMKAYPFPFLLESAKDDIALGRYSFLGCDPFMTFKSKLNNLSICRDGKEETVAGDPIDELRKIFAEFPVKRQRDLPLFQCGAVGMFSYDLHHIFEDLPYSAVDDLDTPDIFLLFVDALMVFDHLLDKLYLVSSGYPETLEDKVSIRKEKRLDFLEAFLKKARVTPLPPLPKSFPMSGLESNFSKKSFEKMVRRAKGYIKAGDIFQVNISQRISTGFTSDPFALYRKLREVNPSPFGCFIDFKDFQIVSSSPERLIKQDGSTLETRPIAGTRPRGKDKAEDKNLSSELFLNEKERAEHIMLVDLERNDLGRISRYGSVHVDELMVIEDYSHVFHIVSSVKGELLPGLDYFDTLSACFPGGTITGTPKIRSMEIIDELEPTRRGVYTGSVGFLSFSGDMDLNIIIRTYFLKNGKAFIQAGCGIVADSVPEREYSETLYKAQALLLALGYKDIDALEIK